jgi:mutual gliding-motility protein MglA
MQWGIKTIAAGDEEPMAKHASIDGPSILYCGPAKAGKRTNLEFLSGSLPGNRQTRLEIVAFGTGELLMFKILPTNDLIRRQLFERNGASGPITVYSLCGAAEECVEIFALIEGMNSVIFVADAQRSRHAVNVTSMKVLNESRLHLNRRLVVQYNKYDRNDEASCTPFELLDRQLNWCNAPSFEAQAIAGQGVVATLSAAILLGCTSQTA